MIGVGEITQERLGIIRDTQESYYPNYRVCSEIAKKSLALLVGPSLTGKSTLIDTIAGHNPKFGKVKSFSTRDPRPDDTPETMECIPWEESEIRRICNVIEAGDGVQYVFHPKTGDIYGTILESYPGRYNLLPALSNSVAPLQKLPFKSLQSIGIVVPRDDFAARIEGRQFASPSDLASRLSEGAISLAWMLDSPDVAIFNNPDGQLGHTAATIRNYIVAENSDNPPRNEAAAEALLRYINSLI